MKICLLSYRGNPYCGGQGIYISYLARQLVKMGHEVHLVVGPPYPHEIDGVKIHRIFNHNYFNRKDDFIDISKPFSTFAPLNAYEFIASKFGVFPEMETFSFRAARLINRLAREHHFDIIHDNQCLGYGYLLLKNSGIPLISTIHHPLTIDRAIWFEYPVDFIHKVKRILYYPLIMQRLVANRMERIITVSDDSAQQITRAFGVPREKISIVYNGMDTGLFYPEKNVRKNRNSLIFVGNIEDRKKGVAYLLKALTLIKNRARLTIVDGGAPTRSVIPDLIDRLGINHLVSFTGKIPIERLNRLYSETEIAVAPSLYEGFGFPAAEAMACRLPVIAAKGGALPEVVGEHMKTGYLVPPRDPEALAKGIDFLIDNPDIRKRLGENGEKRVKSEFRWEKATEEMIRIYREAIDAHR